MLDEELMDERVMGDYDSCVDEMFAYRDYRRQFCSPSSDIVKRLGGWAMFDGRSEAGDAGQKREKFEKLMLQALNSSQRMAPSAGQGGLTSVHAEAEKSINSAV